MTSPEKKSSKPSNDRPSSPRTQLFYDLHQAEMQALDVVLLNVTDRRAQKRLKSEFDARGGELPRDEFAAAVLSVLPARLTLRRAEGVGMQVESAEIAEAHVLEPDEVRATVYGIFDRLDYDGNEVIDWPEMSAFILQQSAVLSDSTITVGATAPYARARLAEYAGERDNGTEGEADSIVVSATVAAERLRDALRGSAASLLGADHGVSVKEIVSRLAPTDEEESGPVDMGFVGGGRRKGLADFSDPGSENDALFNRDPPPPSSLEEFVDYRELTGILRPKRKEELDAAREAARDLEKDSEHQQHRRGLGALRASASLSTVRYVKELDALAVVETRKGAGVDLYELHDVPPGDVEDGGGGDDWTNASLEMRHVGSLVHKGGAVEAMTSFEARGAGAYARPYAVTSHANSSVVLWNLSPGQGQFGVVNTWPTPGAQEALLYTSRYGVLFSGASRKGTVYGWNMREGVQIAALPGHSDTCTALVELAESDRVVSASLDRTLRVWDVTAARSVTTLRGHVRGVTALDVYSPRSMLLSGSFDHSVKMWTAEMNMPVASLEGHSTPVVGVRAPSDGAPEVISASIDGQVRVWDLRQPRSPVWSFLVQEVISSKEHGETTVDTALRTLDLCSRIPTFARSAVAGEAAIASAVADMPPRPRATMGPAVDAGTQVEGKADRSVLSEESRATAETLAMQSTAAAARQPVHQVFFGLKSVVAYTQRQNTDLTVRTARDPVSAVAFSLLRAAILVAAGRSVYAFSAIAGTLLRKFDKVARAPITCMAAESRGVVFAIGTEDGSVSIHNSTTGHAVRRLYPHRKAVTALSWYGMRLVSAGADAKCMLHSSEDTQDAHPDRYMPIGSPASGEHSDSITTVDCDTDLGVIATGGADGTVLVFNAATGNLEIRCRHVASVTCVRFLKGEKAFLSTDTTGTMQLWTMRASGAPPMLIAAFRHCPQAFLSPHDQEDQDDQESKDEEFAPNPHKISSGGGPSNPLKISSGSKASNPLKISSGGGSKASNPRKLSADFSSASQQFGRGRETSTASSTVTRPLKGGGGAGTSSWTRRPSTVSEEGESRPGTGVSSVGDASKTRLEALPPHVMGMEYDSASSLLFTADDEGRVTCWALRELMQATEIHVFKSMDRVGAPVDHVHRRYSMNLSREEIRKSLVSTVDADASAAGAALTLLQERGAFVARRQPVLPEHTPTLHVSGPALASPVWTVEAHAGAVLGFGLLRHPHIPLTVLTGGADAVARATLASDGADGGVLCQAITPAGRNPRWTMPVDCQSWRDALALLEAKNARLAARALSSFTPAAEDDGVETALQAAIEAAKATAERSKHLASDTTPLTRASSTEDLLRMAEAAAAKQPIPPAPLPRIAVLADTSKSRRVVSTLQRMMEDDQEDDNNQQHNSSSPSLARTTTGTTTTYQSPSLRRRAQRQAEELVQRSSTHSTLALEAVGAALAGGRS